MCIETNAFSISFNESGTLWPEIGAAKETPASFFAFQTTELKSINDSVMSVHDLVLDIGDSGNTSISTEDFSYKVVDKW